jgi:hypothetical protein
MATTKMDTKIPMVMGHIRSNKPATKPIRIDIQTDSDGDMARIFPTKLSLILDFGRYHAGSYELFKFERFGNEIWMVLY